MHSKRKRLFPKLISPSPFHFFLSWSCARFSMSRSPASFQSRIQKKTWKSWILIKKKSGIPLGYTNGQLNEALIATSRLNWSLKFFFAKWIAYEKVMFLLSRFSSSDKTTIKNNKLEVSGEMGLIGRLSLMDLRKTRLFHMENSANNN